MDLTPQNFPFYIALEDAANNLNYFKDETIYTMKTFLRSQKRIKDNNGLITLQVESIPIDMVDCDLNYHFPEMKEAFMTIAYQKAYCIAPDQNVTIQGDFPDDIFNFLQVNFYQCMNTTTVSNCKPQDVIDKSIRNTYVSFDYGFYLMRPNNFTYPMQRIKQDYFTTVSNVDYKQINIYLKRIFFNTDMGVIFEDVKEETFNQIDRIQELVTNVVPGPGERLFNIGIRMSYSEDSIFRNYLKLQAVIANIGGLFKFFLIVFEVTLSFLTKDNYFLHLLNENFRISDKDKPFKNDQIKDNNYMIGADKKDSGIELVRVKSDILNAKRNNDLDYLNEHVKIIKQGTKLNLGVCDFVKTFYCRLNSARYVKNRLIYNKAVKVIKKCIDINEVITKLLEYERFKQIMLDNNQLVMFNSSPCSNIEEFQLKKEEKMCLSTFYDDVCTYQKLQESYSKVYNDPSVFNKRLISLYEPHVLDFLKKI
jgi:hypothetical protein